MKVREYVQLSSDIVNSALVEYFRNNPMFNPFPKGTEPTDMVLVEDINKVDKFLLYYDLETVKYYDLEEIDSGKD